MFFNQVSEINQKAYQNFEFLLGTHPIGELLKHHYELFLVGGIVRDFLREGKVGNDIDIEYHHESKAPEEIEKIFHENKIEFEKLSFNIYRINYKQFEIEFAPPRKEVFHGNPPYGHSDFEAKVFSKLSIDDAILRRDFTINSMMLRMSLKDINQNQLTFLDPLNGLEDLQIRELNNCSELFFNDPVRFLRTIRFQHKLQFKISKKLKQDFSKFDLSQCTSYHLFKEWEKSKNDQFLNEVFTTAKLFSIALPIEWDALKGFFNRKAENRFKDLFEAYCSIADDDVLVKYFQAILAIKQSDLSALNVLRVGLKELKDELEIPSEFSKLDQDQKLMEQLVLRKKLLSHLSFYKSLDLGGRAKEVVSQINSMKDAIQALNISREDYQRIPNEKRWLLPIFLVLSAR